MNIVLGVTGGIAAYKSVALVRLLAEAGHDVHVIPTADALRFVGQPTWEALSRHPVTTSVHDDVPEVRHVAHGQNADLIVVAPATANTLARMTAGLADDLLGTTLLATRAPVLVAPAMHTEMWQHPATQDNVAILRSRGVAFVGPESGRLTGSDSGPGRMSEPEEIFRRISLMLEATAAAAQPGAGMAAQVVDDVMADPDPVTRVHEVMDDGDLGDDDLADEFAELEGAAAAESLADAGLADHDEDFGGVRILVTAGGTREPIDPVRFIGNRSSGRQGVAVAAAAAARGAKVVMLAANIDGAVLQEIEGDPAIRIVPVSTTAELDSAAHAAATGADVVVMAAAVADYRVADVADAKIRKEETGGEAPTITLVENPDILAALVRERREGQLLVGFAAETAETEDELIERGRRKRARKGVDLLAVNAVGWHEGFEQSDNTLHLIDDAGEVSLTVSGSKRQTADGLLDAVRELLDTAV